MWSSKMSLKSTNSILIFLLIIYTICKAAFTTDLIEIGQLVPKIQAVEELYKQYDTKKLPDLFSYVSHQYLQVATKTRFA